MMNHDFIKNEDVSYKKAEQNATHYFQLINKLVTEKTYIPVLTKDFQSWKQNHIHHSLLPFSYRKNTSNSRGYRSYIQWLHYRGKLDHYLDRSVSYIFMRDLGKALDSPETESGIRRLQPV